MKNKSERLFFFHKKFYSFIIDLMIRKHSTVKGIYNFCFVLKNTDYVVTTEKNFLNQLTPYNKRNNYLDHCKQ